MEDVLAALTAALARGESVAMVTIVAAHGSTPQRVGAKMLVFADGRTVGTIGGGCYEHDAFCKAREALGTRRSQLVHYELSDDLAEESGLICGGQMDVFIEPIEPAPHLYILGAGHVGFQLGQIAPTVGFRLHVVDDRQKFANHERFPVGRRRDRRQPRRVGGLRRDSRHGVRRRAHARPSAGLRRAARARGTKLPLRRPDRQPRQGRAPHRRAARDAACRPTGCAACARRSASTSARSRPRRSRWPSSPS